MRGRYLGASTVLACASILCPDWIAAQNLTTDIYNNYGNPGGLIDMPTAEMAPDAEFGLSVSGFDNYLRTQINFQITRRLSGTFRYSATEDINPSFNTYYDRSFDLKFRLLDETRLRPAVAIGLRDFIGTGVLAGEYIVATKSIGPQLRVTGGIGWGRLGSYASSFSTGSRAPFSFATAGNGGTIDFDEWFRGDAAFFGGASYRVNDKLQIAAEYSSDNYDLAQNAGILNRRSPWNVALDYKISDDLTLRGFYLYGSEIGASLTLTFNPKRPAVPGGTGDAPLPVAVRTPGSAQDLGWTTDPGQKEATISVLDSSLDQAELDLEGVTLEGRRAHVVIRNDRYDMSAQALGRTLRSMSRELPASVEEFQVTLVRYGMPVSTMTFRRSDLERLENAPASDALALAAFQDPLRFGRIPDPLPGTYPRFEWTVGPYLKTSFFDPDQSVRADAGIQLSAAALLGRGWIVSGAVTQKIVGNLDDIQRSSDSVLPRVRSDVALFYKTNEPVLEDMTVAKYARLAPDFYGRVTGGYLERMYAGLSGEVLWKPVESRLAIGAEVNYVHWREFDGGFGLRERDSAGRTLPEVNGHVSAYYDFGNGFHGQLDAGRYLAGDWGATISIDREFANGWRVGAFATKTDVSSSDFGEGSFDRGLRFTVPLSWLLGKPTTQEARAVIRPLTRDGGQRVDVRDRLYPVVRRSHQPEIAKSWGTFWR
ncbi:MAG: YjbH domain-containing protein [Pseudomonadota bacterium]